MSQDDQEKEQLGFKDAYFSAKYRFAHWNSFILAAFTHCSGLSFILIFAVQLFQQMKKDGKFQMSIPLAV